MSTGTTALLHSYIEYQKYLINEMVYNVPKKNGKKLIHGDLQNWNKKMFADISKLESEIKRLQEKYDQEQRDDAKAFNIYNSISKRKKYEIENLLDTKKIKKWSTKKVLTK